MFGFETFFGVFFEELQYEDALNMMGLFYMFLFSSRAKSESQKDEHTQRSLARRAFQMHLSLHLSTVPKIPVIPVHENRLIQMVSVPY